MAQWPGGVYLAGKAEEAAPLSAHAAQPVRAGETSPLPRRLIPCCFGTFALVRDDRISSVMM